MRWKQFRDLWWSQSCESVYLEFDSKFKFKFSRIFFDIDVFDLITSTNHKFFIDRHNLCYSLYDIIITSTKFELLLDCILFLFLNDIILTSTNLSYVLNYRKPYHFLHIINNKPSMPDPHGCRCLIRTNILVF
jgi:hypothetical protein